MTITEMLQSKGWKRISVRKVGCFKHVLWLDPKTNMVWPQNRAVENQRYRNAVARDAKKRVFVRVDARDAAKSIQGESNGEIHNHADGRE